MAANTHTQTGRYLTRFAIWLLQQPELDSNLGFRASDLDLIWENEQQNLWMILEVKCLGRSLPRFQAKIIKRLHDLASADPTYLGAHTIVFQRTNPEDGKTYLDGREVDQDLLRQFLEFKCEAELYRRGPFPQHRRET